MRNSNQFDRIVKNLRSFVDRIRHNPLAHPKLSLWYLGTRENIAELPDFIRLAAAIGVREVYLQRLVYFQDDDGYGLATSEKDPDGFRWQNPGIGEIKARLWQNSLIFTSMPPVWQHRSKACAPIPQTGLPGKSASARKP